MAQASTEGVGRNPYHVAARAMSVITDVSLEIKTHNFRAPPTEQDSALLSEDQVYIPWSPHQPPVQCEGLCSSLDSTALLGWPWPGAKDGAADAKCHRSFKRNT